MAGKSLKLEFPKSGYRRSMPFNRFQIERVDNLIISHFGLVSNSGLLLDRYSCAIFALELEYNKDSLMDYLGKVGTLADPPPVWQAHSVQLPVELFNQINVTSNPQLAETTLHNVTARAIAESTGSSIQFEGVALLRSGLSLQAHWIRALYDAAS